jgi:hypothetical protein
MIHDEEGPDLPPEGDVMDPITRILEDLHQNGMLASAEGQGWQVGITDCSGHRLVSVALKYPYLECTCAPLN